MLGAGGVCDKVLDGWKTIVASAKAVAKAVGFRALAVEEILDIGRSAKPSTFLPYQTSLVVQELIVQW